MVTPKWHTKCYPVTALCTSLVVVSYYIKGMPYLSQLIGKPIRNRAGNSVARLRDVVIDLAQVEAENGPLIKGLVARTARRKAPFYLPVEQVDTLTDERSNVKLGQV